MSLKAFKISQLDILRSNHLVGLNKYNIITCKLKNVILNLSLAIFYPNQILNKLFEI